MGWVIQICLIFFLSQIYVQLDEDTAMDKDAAMNKDDVESYITEFFSNKEDTESQTVSNWTTTFLNSNSYS